MLHLIRGRSGTGKTTFLFEKIRQCLAENRECILLVPEQNAVAAEKKAARDFRDVDTFSLEILNFRRLANHVFRSVGGLAGESIDKCGKEILMWRVVASLLPFLTEYANLSPADTFSLKLLLDTCEGLRRRRVTPSMLERAAGKVTQTKLKNKLNDLSLILSSYSGFLKEDFSDVTEQTDRLIDLLGRENFFAGKTVFLDSFDGFTGQEYALLEKIFAQADEVWVTLVFDPSDRSPLFTPTGKTRSALLRLADSFEEIDLGENRSFASEGLRLLEKNFPLVLPRTTLACGEELRVFECADRYDECLAVAEDIARRVREEGARYRDFAVICRDPGRYEGLIDFAFDSLSLPLFTSRRVDLGEKAIVKYIFTALTLTKNGWQTEDVILHLKTGLTALSPRECDLVETYARRWSVKGKRWTNDDGWTANPDGFRPLNEKSAARLAELNEIRQRFVQPLIKMEENFSGRSTVRDKCAALFTFLCENGIPARLAERASLSGSGEEDKRVWKTVVDALDKLVLTAGEVETDTEQFIALLKMLLSATDIGVLPTSTDEVLFGSAAALRTNGVKHTYLIGCNNGIFPGEVKENALFSDAEKREILSTGTDFLPENSEEIYDEIFFFYRAASTPSRSLTFTHLVREDGKVLSPSFLLGNIISLFSLSPIRHADAPLLSRAEGYTHSFPLLTEYPMTSVALALEEIYRADPSLSESLRKRKIPLTLEKLSLSPETANSLFGKDLSLSQSKTDAYVKCPFSFFLKYLLCAEEEEESRMSRAEIGSYFHHVFENVLRHFCSEGAFEKEKYDGEKQEYTRRVTEDYLKSITNDKEPEPKLVAFFERLRTHAVRLADDLAEEIGQAEFRPILFEQKIDEKHIPPLLCPMPDGGQVSLRGIIDRVDEYETEEAVYLRVIDYKSGSKQFSFESIEHGLDIQTLVYLFALCENYRKDKPVLPAGAAYYQATPSTLSFSVTSSAEEVEKKGKSGIIRSGVWLRDPDVLKKMDRELKGKYTCAKFGSDNKMEESDFLIPPERFDELKKLLRAKIAGIGTGIKQGHFDADPLKSEQEKIDACKYCPYSPVCRRDRNENENNEEGEDENG